MPLNLEFSQDGETFRNSLNGHGVVMHSHHYLALITKLAEDMSDLDGPRILARVVEESMRKIFDDYIGANGIASPQDRGLVGRDYYPAFGLGKMIVSGNETGGEVRLVSSHLDEGWVRKWGPRQEPLNHFTCGYIAAMFGATFGKPLGSYSVREVCGIAAGNRESIFNVTLS